MNEQLIPLIESIQSSALIESIYAGYSAIFEARSVPDLAFIADGKLKRIHQFRLVTDGPTNKTYYVVAKGSTEPIIMVVQITLKYPTMGMWMVNFVQKGQSDFNVTNSGSFDSIASVMAVIKHFIDTEHPKFICYNATDTDETKRKQKDRIYTNYLTGFGGTRLTNVPKALAHLSAVFSF